VSSTPLGLFIQHESSTELWSIPDAVSLRQCVIGNDGDAAACVGDGDVFLFERRPAGAASSGPP
jgi:hypothetical protein